MSFSSKTLLTAGLTASALTLGIPVAIAAIALSNAYIPNVTLRTQTINVGPSGNKNLTFGPLPGSSDAVQASSYMSIIFSILLAVGFVVLRHLGSRIGRFENLLGWVVAGPATLNLLGQIGSLLAWAILQGKDDAKIAQEGDITYVNGRYDTGGRLFTKEAWACSMEKYFNEQEGSWAGKSCSNLKAARFLTIGTVICAVAMLGVAIWQVRERGGVAGLIGKRQRRKSFGDVTKADYVEF